MRSAPRVILSRHIPPHPAMFFSNIWRAQWNKEIYGKLKDLAQKKDIAIRAKPL